MCLTVCTNLNFENGRRGEGGASQSFAYLNHQCRMGIPSRGYRMGIPGSIPVRDAHTASYIKLSYGGPSQHELPSRVQFLLISKAFIALNVFIPKFNYFILFCVFLWFP